MTAAVNLDRDPAAGVPAEVNRGLLKHEDVLKPAILVREQQPARPPLLEWPHQEPALTTLVDLALWSRPLQLVKPSAFRGLLLVPDELGPNRDLPDGDRGRSCPVPDVRVERQGPRTAPLRVQRYRQADPAGTIDQHLPGVAGLEAEFFGRLVIGTHAEFVGHEANQRGGQHASARHDVRHRTSLLLFHRHRSRYPP